jgi:hypothetical protein
MNMKTKHYALLTAALVALTALPAMAETQTVVTKEVNSDGMGGTTTTTTRYYYNDTDANNNGILDSQEFPRFVYNSWDLNGDGFRRGQRVEHEYEPLVSGRFHGVQNLHPLGQRPVTADSMLMNSARS